MRVYRYLSEKGLRPETCHTSNSACILAHPETQIDMVREGIMLYGMYPDSVPRQGELRPVMTLKTRVSQVRELPAGTTVSYGRTYRSDTPCLLYTSLPVPKGRIPIAASVPMRTDATSFTVPSPPTATMQRSPAASAARASSFACRWYSVKAKA